MVTLVPPCGYISGKNFGAISAMLGQNLPTPLVGIGLWQTVSCEIEFAHAHVRARLHMCDVSGKRLLKLACDVRACGRFSYV